MGTGLVHLFLAGSITLGPLIVLLILFAALGDKKSEDALGFGCVVLIVGAIAIIYGLYSMANQSPYSY